MAAATELRHDPVTGRPAIVAAGRATRPHTVARSGDDAGGAPATCPFCPGHEHLTPPEVFRTGPGDPGTTGWRVRVVPNLYPIVGGADAGEGATGEHEVVVLSPEHHRSFGSLDDEAASEVFRVLRTRIARHLDAGLAYGVAIVNHGRAAGASIAHPHAQVIVLDFVPPEVQAAARRFAATTDDLLDVDLDTARRHDTLLLDGEVPAWFPYGAGSAFTVRVAHPDADARFDAATDAVADATALAIRDALAALAATLSDPAYNVTVHTAAADGTGPSRWYAEITPRLSVVAGFEMATGIGVSTTPAEQAAKLVRGDAA